MAEGRHVWKHHETLALIDVWEEKFFLLKTQRRTSYLHDEIKQTLAARGIHKSIRQIVVKIDNMTQKYRKTKCEGKQNPYWIYFRRLDSFMGKLASSVKMEIMDEDEKPEEITLDLTIVNAPQNQNPPIQIASIQGSHCEPDSSRELFIRNPVTDFSNHHQNEVLNVLKHCLSIHEKVVDLTKDILDTSSKSGISDTERH
ncbi:hypothetical protein AVEN_121449-1 [Araneus ventricosus]|uniref:Myb/SANT-like DNA-binding domain-containing protein n=1 Tax=Araneus ventricosus TaxID=182803 RepID=A0A4Y2DN09_ARAVE|nr:hypothetical protein AVEN_121449-1 [Araneus ventricosus]